jgi:hypothetical protein
MYLRVSRGRFDPANYDQVVAALQGATAIRRLPGYQSSCWAADQTVGTLIALSTWLTPEQAAFSRTDANPPERESFLMEDAGFHLDAPEIFEIVASHP